MKLLNRVKESIVRMLAESESELRPVTAITPKSTKEPVFNFTTETHTYCLAEDVVVHNCDTISMLSVMGGWEPSQEVTMKKNDDTGIWEVDDFEEDVVEYATSYLA